MKSTGCLWLLVKFLVATIFISLASQLLGQTTLRGKVVDSDDHTAVIGAHVRIPGSGTGTITDADGLFAIDVSSLPAEIIVSSIGYESTAIEILKNDQPIEILLQTSINVLDEIRIEADARSDKHKRSAQNVEVLDRIFFKQIASHDAYEAAASLRGMDGLTVGFGNVVLNARGFASTSPVRSLQVIDGVDNQSPGLNFSLGNFLGAPDLDILRIDLIQGPASAFYGPNAFNGVIDIRTRDPFIHQGLEACVKYGERNLIKGELRYAQAFKNSHGEERLAFKLNAAFMRANDWEASNILPTDQSPDTEANPGGYDAVNIYGDEYDSYRDYTGSLESIDYPGLGRFYRRGYAEKDLVDYNTVNYKGNVALHYRIVDNTEVIAGFNFGSGTTIYQGENRFRLKDIFFWQGKLEIRQEGKFFLRAYTTDENAGKTYDAYFTALRLQDLAKHNSIWNQEYIQYWQTRVIPKVKKLPDDPKLRMDSLHVWQALAQNHANSNTFRGGAFFEPGTARFDSVLNVVTSHLATDSILQGTRFFDRSGLKHVHGEYLLKPAFADIVLGANYRQYNPDSRGTIFADTSGRRIINREFGVYTGVSKDLVHDKVNLSFTFRLDKNQNFDAIASPAVSVVLTPADAHTFRLGFSSALRNPTLADQYLHLDVGRALLLGNISGYDSLITVESFIKYLNCLCRDSLKYFNVPQIRPERVKSLEFGYRGYVVPRLWVDASYYYSWYTDFIGYRIGIRSEFDQNNFPVRPRAWRVSSNAATKVTTQGFSIGAAYALWKGFTLSGNYAWNALRQVSDDPLIPAYNTPEHKFNIGLSGRDIPLRTGRKQIRGFGFSINYKWVEGFLFEGSPQFTGRIDSYGLLDAQVNWSPQRTGLTFKIGATNALNNKHHQVYGGPEVGRLAYVSVLYEGKRH